MVHEADTDVLLRSLARSLSLRHGGGTFVVTEREAAGLRAVFYETGEFSAAVELRRLYPGIGSLAQARESVRTIAGWEAPPPMPTPTPDGKVIEFRLRRPGRLQGREGPE